MHPFLSSHSSVCSFPHHFPHWLFQSFTTFTLTAFQFPVYIFVASLQAFVLVTTSSASLTSLSPSLLFAPLLYLQKLVIPFLSLYSGSLNHPQVVYPPTRKMKHNIFKTSLMGFELGSHTPQSKSPRPQASFKTSQFCSVTVPLLLSDLQKQ